ncbi:MAG: protein kinase [Kofleriaceae bacterium]
MSEQNLAGRTLGDRYDVLDLIGAGGMGAVYRARDRELDELVALKVIREDLAQSDDIVDRFRSEVKLARRVTHHNVARTFELGHIDGVMFCTMELVDGESLTARLRRERKLPVADAVAIAIAVCDGLSAAHARDVIHRDIKPDNILLAHDGRVIVADFGVAAVSVGDVRDPSGTPAYMAPEQALGEPPTPAVDVYALGIVLHEMLTGRRAFQGSVTKILDDKALIDRVAAAPNEMPIELAEIIGRATQRDRDLRIQTAGQLRRALEPYGKPARASSNYDVATAARELLPADVSTVFVVAPTGLGSARFYLAEAVHEEVVARLGRIPRVRPQPRVQVETAPDDLVVTMAADERLAVTIARHGDVVAQLSVPLSIAQLDPAAIAIVDAVTSAIDLAAIRPAENDSDHAVDLMFRARHIAIRDMERVQEAMVMLTKAQAEAPRNPKIAAMLAIAQVRLAFFMGSLDASVLVRAGELARAAVAAAPDQVLAHLAMGYVELNTGDCAIAAGHFRVAISCAPHSPDAHEQLGRMLLEAGYLEQAIERLEDAIAINPNVRTARWEIARAYALEGRWAENEALVKELMQMGGDRPISQARYAWWRRDLPRLAALREQLLDTQQMFVPGLIHQFVDTYLKPDWPRHRAALLEIAAKLPKNKRRLAFTSQLIAEAAAYHEDIPTALAQIEFAIDQGLFDLHWLDKCPLLDNVRLDPGYAPLRQRIKRRADAILDALYGDHAIGTSETAVAD